MPASPDVVAVRRGDEKYYDATVQRIIRRIGRGWDCRCADSDDDLGTVMPMNRPLCVFARIGAARATRTVMRRVAGIRSGARCTMAGRCEVASAAATND